MSTANTAPRLNCEALEDRSNPDGNAFVAVSNGNIFVQGDNFSNHVQITQDGFGNVFAIGINNTTVNGVSVLFLGTFTPNNITINGAGGADTLQVFNLNSTGTIAFDPGDEFDRVDVGNVQAAAVVVSAGAGNDTVVLDNVFTNFMWLDGGNDFDVLHLGNVFSNSPNVMNFEQLV